MASVFVSSPAEVVLVDSRTRPGTITLPLTNAIPFRVLNFKDQYGTFFNSTLTLTTQAGESFDDGTTSKVFSNAFGAASLYATSSKWMVLNATTTVQQTISSLTVNQLTFGTGAGWVQFGPVQASVVSTIQVQAQSGFVGDMNLGTTSTVTTLDYFGLFGAYNNTVLAEISTGAGTQELLVFKGSSTSDRVRVQTTGTFVVETGVSARLFNSNTTQTLSNVTPAFIVNANSNVGIQTANPGATLDVAGTGRFQILSTQSLNVSSLQIQSLQISSLQVSTLRTTTLSSAVGTFSSLVVRDNVNSTGTLFQSTSFLYYNNFILAGTRVAFGQLFTFLGAPAITTQGLSSSNVGGNYIAYSWTSTSGTNTITVTGGIAFVDFLIVAGGGGGGYDRAAGGGAGGLIYTTGANLSPGTYTITVGAGGTGATSAVTGGSGGNSAFNGLTAIGGGGGGSIGTTPGNGGSGGGGTAPGGGNITTNGGTATAGQGNAGGSGNYSSPTSSAAGGGGGAGSVGSNGTALAVGTGGAGLAISITGSSVFYAGGGGGARGQENGGGGGAGGAGGGGNAAASAGGAGSNGTNGLGGGGGGGGNGPPGNGGTGGSGIVIIRVYS